ncbi:MAG: amidohydrolase family protein [Tepidisphaerales bacterium]
MSGPLAAPAVDAHTATPASTPSSPSTSAPSPPPRAGPPPAGDPSEYNRLGLDYRSPLPRPPVRGLTIDWHSHLLAVRHAPGWFEAADHYGIDCFVTMAPLEEAVGLQRHYGPRLHFIAVPDWRDSSPHWRDNWLRRIEAFYNLGSRIAKFHMAPESMARRGWRLNHEVARPLLEEVAARGMLFMSHVGDPDLWYATRYADTARFGSRDDHYAMWEQLLERYAPTPWIGAHLGGNPENLPRLQRLLDRYPHLYLDLSATRWMVRELSRQRDAAREFILHNADRLLFGTDQVSGNDRGFDFLASRFWAHRKLWETNYIGPTNIRDPDLPEEAQPTLRGLGLPSEVLQKIYHDNAQRLLASVGAAFPE